MSTEPCDCIGWADMDPRYTILTGHASSCPKGPNAMMSAFGLISKLADGINEWAQDCDGVPEALWPSFEKAWTIAHGRPPAAKESK